MKKRQILCSAIVLCSLGFALPVQAYDDTARPGASTNTTSTATYSSGSQGIGTSTTGYGSDSLFGTYNTNNKGTVRGLSDGMALRPHPYGVNDYNNRLTTYATDTTPKKTNWNWLGLLGLLGLFGLGSRSRTDTR
ncbi:WGxxGxxG family protein [Paenibacillus cremeus]|uniref:WGxxGxxG-CTERM domain-containing protein n=1 Tax=Paenibacillus cremeus TaxID=2163881 RepID=A0A559KEF8_9BACL|nr:WGxxGxxG family protein [Paenibacillus cremeus]TVY10514.1 hypothetical protein FPZ49_07190 [Paenibacillus cremeus]